MPIDDYFFEMLHRHISAKDIDELSLLRYIHRKGVPRNVYNCFDSLLGFVMEAHVKLVLSQLEDDFPIHQFGSGSTGFAASPVFSYVPTAWGNVLFYRERDGNSRSSFAEIDALYTWQAGTEIPMIIEVTRCRGNKNVVRKAELMGTMYEGEPYFVKVLLSRRRGPLGILQETRPYGAGDYHFTRILLPNDGRYDAIALRLAEQAPR